MFSTSEIVIISLFSVFGFLFLISTLVAIGLHKLGLTMVGLTLLIGTGKIHNPLSKYFYFPRIAGYNQLLFTGWRTKQHSWIRTTRDYYCNDDCCCGLWRAIFKVSHSENNPNKVFCNRRMSLHHLDDQNRDQLHIECHIADHAEVEFQSIVISVLRHCSLHPVISMNIGYII